MTCKWVPQLGNHQRHIVILLVTLISACATHIPVSEREAVRKEIDTAANETITTLTKNKPEIQEELEASTGYLAARVSGTKIPLVGGGYGLGVLVDQTEDTRTYMNISGLDIGVGLGQATMRALIVIKDEETLEQFRNGKWVSSTGSTTASGDVSSLALSSTGETSGYYFGESGLGATATTRLIKLSVNEDLTDTGISDISIPNIGFDDDEPQQEGAPRKWNRKLPFLAQNVIDLGYDLPLPFGIGLVYANVDQDIILTELEVGFYGSEKEPFEFVAFENASADSESVQLKLDAWLFPFMNVFGLIGRVQGDAIMDVLLDGNGMLDKLGVTCSPPPPPQDPRCAVLQDNTITLPIVSPFDGMTYGIGTVLAGGWNNWLVTLPISFTYADTDSTDTEGFVTTVSPRFGRLLNLDQYGKLALFAGGNYMHAKLDVSGTYFLPIPGDDDLEINYDIKQENADEWNLVLGGNWDINKTWSVMAEYNGFIGSREAFIASIGFRY